MKTPIKNIIKKNSLSIALLSTSLISGLALAHPGHDTTPGFLAGALHPLTGLDHLLVIFLVGFWSASNLKKAWAGPALFMMGMTIGLIAGIMSLPMALVEPAIALSVALIGLLILSKKDISKPLVLALMGCFAVFHGYAHALDAQNSLSVIVQDMAGLLVTTAALHLAGIFIAKKLSSKQLLLSNAFGAISLAYGCVVLGQFGLLAISGSLV